MDIEENEKRQQNRRLKKVLNPEGVVKELEARCTELGLKVIYDDLRSEGGVCRVHNRWLVIINRRSSAATKIRILEQALRRVEKAVTSVSAANQQESVKPAMNTMVIRDKAEPS
jgi:hypothetical protein|uniref:Uncharacterized protein n=1 Tax=candidate division WOR-3 bacterium TaxID=2052148 RepID=A0A7V3PTL6_UNCW3